jgi:hypothetical protein
VIDQVRGALRHASRPARGAESASLATERQEIVVAAIDAAQAQEAVRQDAALQESVELVFDELRLAGAKGLLSLGKEALGVLLHHAETTLAGRPTPEDIALDCRLFTERPLNNVPASEVAAQIGE